MSELSGFYALWYREIKVFLREKSRIVSSLINPLMWLLIFGTGLGSALGASVSSYGGNYQAFIFPGILCMTILFGTIFFGAYIVMDKKIDFLKEVLVAPISRTTIFFGKVVGGTTDALVESAILLALGPFFGMHYTIVGLFGIVGLILLLSISMTSVGLTIGSFMESPEGFGLLVGFLIFPLFFLSGALFPVNNLPSWLHIFVSLNPVSYAVDAMRGVLLGVHALPLFIDVAVMFAFAFIMIGIGTWSFSRLKP